MNIVLEALEFKSCMEVLRSAYIINIVALKGS